MVLLNIETETIALYKIRKINIKNCDILKFKPIEKTKYTEILEAFNVAISKPVKEQLSQPLGILERTPIIKDSTRISGSNKTENLKLNHDIMMIYHTK